MLFLICNIYQYIQRCSFCFQTRPFIVMFFTAVCVISCQASMTRERRAFTKPVTFQKVRELFNLLEKKTSVFNYYCRKSGTISADRFLVNEK